MRSILDVGIDFGAAVPRDFHAQALKLGHAVKGFILGVLP